MEQVIFHCDANSFFASCELLAYPELLQKPVAVCGSTDNRHGIILAKNEAAKKFKIATAETVWQAKRKCPDLILLPPHHYLYSKYSKIINEIYSRFSDKVEPFGIDESWLDMTGTWQLFGKSPKEVANILRETVKLETNLTISIGVSFNKMFAKLGSDYKKPDAVTVFDVENYKYKVWPLPVNSLMYVGKSVEQTLELLNIRNIGQLAGADVALLTEKLGKNGAELIKYARGDDNSQVCLYGEKAEVKSVGNNLTFKRNLISEQDIKTGAASLADEVARRLRRHGLFCMGVQVTIKDKQLKTICRQKRLVLPTHLAKEISTAALELILANWKTGEPIRMLSVTAISLTDGDMALQTSFLDEKKPDKKREALEKSMDSIRLKYGKHSIASCNVIKNDLGIAEIKMHDMEDD